MKCDIIPTIPPPPPPPNYALILTQREASLLMQVCGQIIYNGKDPDSAAAVISDIYQHLAATIKFPDSERVETMTFASRSRDATGWTPRQVMIEI